MRRLLRVGKRLVAVGVVLDLGFHVVTEREEAFSLGLPKFELADHLLIAVGVGVTVLMALALFVRAAWRGREGFIAALKD